MKTTTCFYGWILAACVGLSAILGAQNEVEAVKNVPVKKISVDLKVLKIKKAETILLSNPKTVIEDGREGTCVMGRKIPVKNEQGETKYYDDTIELKVTPKIVPEQGIELTIEAVIRGYDKKKMEPTVTTVKKCELIGNLETVVLELMENKQEKSRLVFQLTSMIQPEAPEKTD